MAGIRRGAMRPKAGKNLRGAAKQKRHKNNTEAQAKYHTKINARRAKKMKK
jgi:hypothetical protein